MAVVQKNRALRGAERQSKYVKENKEQVALTEANRQFERTKLLQSDSDKADAMREAARVRIRIQREKQKNAIVKGEQTTNQRCKKRDRSIEIQTTNLSVLGVQNTNSAGPSRQRIEGDKQKKKYDKEKITVSEVYLPGFGPKAMLCGGDPAKVKSLKGFKIPKKVSSPVNNDSELSLNSSLNSSRSLENTQIKMSDLDSPARNAFKNVLGSPSSSSDPYKCFECNLAFKVQAELDLHVSNHYNPRQQSSSKGYSTKKLKCPLCSQYFDDMPNMKDHLKAKHKSGRSEKKHDLWCALCRKGFESEKKFEDHEKLDHKYACSHCHKAYILEVDLNHHVDKNHNIQTRHKEGFTCKLCGENISEMEMFKIHQSQGHNVPCYTDGCEKRFQHKKELLAHLKIKHNIVQIRMIGDDSEDEHRGYLTTERSQPNIDIAEWAESWVDSAMAIDHMVKVVKGVVKSRRHDLFLDKRERDKCSGSGTSRLYQLSNPGFLEGGGEKDTVVIKHLIDRVFMVNFPMADNRLKDLGVGSAFVYTICVLFPETFIHQHQVQGKKSKEEAEQAFMEVAVDVEERKGLNQEIKEAAVRNRRDSDEDSGDEWVDHIDMEEDLED